MKTPDGTSSNIDALTDQWRSLKRTPAAAAPVSPKAAAMSSKPAPPPDTTFVINGPADTDGYRKVREMAEAAWTNSPAIRAQHPNKYIFAATMIRDAEQRGATSRPAKVRTFTNPKDSR